MKIALASDLHLEFKGQKEIPPVPDCDVVVLAGDIGKMYQGVQYAESLNKPVIYIPGNHEPYGFDIDELFASYSSYSHDRVKILNPGKITLGDVTFICAPLYSSLRLPGYNDYPIQSYGKAISDFIVTRKGNSLWSPLDHVSAHVCQRSYIADKLMGTNGKKVVVTHFLPSMQCIDPFFKNDNLNPYFCNDLDSIINIHKPEAWLYGHTHSKLDKMHSNGKTRLVCNPRGYPNEKKSFKWKIIEV